MKKFLVAISVVMLVFGLTACQSGSTSSAAQIQDEKYLVLVNKENKLPDDWLDQIELVTARNTLGEEFQVERVALENYEALRTEALANGVGIELDSTYRSVDEQQEIWDEFTEEYGIDYVKSHVAVPGYSEHHTGLAVDIFIMKDGQEIRENEEMVADREDFAIVHSLLADHGFILRYPEGKDDLTGYAYEPWHFRYVGSIDVAREITNKGLTFEEYLDSKK